MTILLALLLSGISHAQDVRVSLLTCSPSGEVYAQYGHTALRVQRESDSLDYAFNYGVFSFDQPNFMW
ncbi:MAG: DUF4105 domain-containing protein, partial [Bacteroidaceae bacterium]|nr:DUF4105 domain-containing protein [Bacteroidaceae bacterium]